MNSTAAAPLAPLSPAQLTARLIVALTVVGIFLLPFTSLPVLPSKYRPISIFFFMPFGLIYLMAVLFGLKQRVRTDTVLLLLFGYSFVYSTLLVAGGALHAALFARYFAVIVIGVFTYYGMLLGLRVAGPLRTYSALRATAWMFVSLGLFDFWCLYAGGPRSLMEALNHVFAYDLVGGRITVTTEEAAWAAAVGLALLCCLVAIANVFKLRNGPLVYLLGLVTLATLSLAGVLTILIMVVVYTAIVVIPRMNLRHIRNLILGVVALAVGVTALVDFVKANPRGAYYAQRIAKIASVAKLSQIVFVDGSVFIRVMYPYIGLQMAVDHPLGVGVGGFTQHFTTYITRIAPISRLEMFTEVRADLESAEADPKNLWARTVSEQGVPGLILLLIFVAGHLSGGMRSQYWRERTLLVSFAVASTQSFGSFAFVQFWFALALARCLGDSSWCADNRPLPKSSG